MLILALGLGLTAILLVNVGYRYRSQDTQLGSMSQSWIAAYNASQPACSQ